MQEEVNIAEYNQEPEARRGWKGKLEHFLDSKYFLWVVIILVAITSFCFGRVSKIQSEREPVRAISNSLPPNPLPKEGGTGQKTADQSATAIKSQILPKSDLGGKGVQVVGSKNGTKYHLPSCPGAKQISEQNKITFNSIEEARAKGYTAASNCKGLK